MTELAELINAYHEHQLELSGLFDAVASRGALPENEHRTELAWIEQLRDGGEIDSAVAGALTLRLQAAQQADRTGAANDATVIKPALSPDDVATVVQPASRPAMSEDATVVKPSSQWTGRTTGTRSIDGSLDQATWRRVAEAQVGEVATVGMLLKGRFLLERELGRGGMGVVFLARDERKVEARDRDPYVAVKVLNDEFRRHPDSLIALQREARRAQQLGQDNIVRVYDFDKDGTIVFMTMEYIDGTDLRSLIREQGFDGMALEQAWPLITGMARALDRAHASGVVHSDFKPGNVMVTRAGQPKVFDFGIARAGKFIDEAGEQTVFDASTLGALTPAYASLEMIQGKEPSPGDDIYAFGCVIFELLTGKHPFDKVSAEVAMKEGRRPPPVPGLTKRQYKALCDSIAFEGAQRLQSAAALVEGLRRRGLRERYAPVVTGSIVAAVALAVGGVAMTRYLDHRHIDAVMARFAPGAIQPYVDETQAMQALDGLDPEERNRIVLEQSETIQSFLLRRLDAYWNPAKGREDFAGAQQIWRLRNELKLFSPALDARHNQIVAERAALLNTLDTQLNQAISDNLLFEDQPGNVVPTLAHIRAIDPQSASLKNPELELKYDAAIGQSVGDGKIDQAQRQLAVAMKLFPDSRRLQARQAQLTAQSSVAAAASSVPAPATSALAATSLPSSSSLPEQQQQLDQEAAGAEVASRIESVRLGAAANDSAKAQESLDRIKALQPQNPFLASEGPQLVSSAYIGQARAACMQGHWAEAASVAGQGVKALGNRPELRNAKERFDLLVAITGARNSTKPISSGDFDKLQARLANARRVDPAGVKQLESDMAASGKLPQGSLDALMELLKTKVVAGPVDDLVGDRPVAANGAGLAVTSGADPCNQPALMGKGRSCVDLLSDGARSPSMVTVPAARGQHAFAVTRNEISVSEYNRFCASTHRCNALPASARDGDLPARNIYLSQARSYASWLTAMTGYVYRLPTDDEWVYAAHAGVDWKHPADGFCAPSKGKPAAAPIAKPSGANPWGLVNLAGNVGEWVTDGSRVRVRGGGYLTPAGDCDVDNHRDDKGAPQPDVGFRLVRELK